MSTVVSAKIPKRLRQQLREKHVHVSSVVREALEKEVARKDDKLSEKPSVALRGIGKNTKARLGGFSSEKLLRQMRKEDEEEL